MPRCSSPSRSSRSAEPDLAQQVDGRLLEDAGPDPRRDVLLRAGLDHDRLDALGGRAGARAASRPARPRRSRPGCAPPAWQQSTAPASAGDRGSSAHRKRGIRRGDPSHGRRASFPTGPALVGCPAWTRPPDDLAGRVGLADRRADPGGPPAGVPRCAGPFALDRPVGGRTLYATAHGIYEAFLNGERVGDAELTPGFTQYDAPRRCRPTTSPRCCGDGRNALGALLADGWFRGQIGIDPRRTTSGGPSPRCSPSCSSTHDDGSVTVVGTEPDWRWSPATSSPPTSSPASTGTCRLPRGWAPGFDDALGAGHACVDHGYAGLVDSPAPPVRRVEELVPVVGDPAAPRRPGRRPRPEHQRLGPADRPRARPAPTLDADPRRVARPGRRRHHRPPARRPCRSCPSRCRPARSTGSSPPASPGDVFEPRRTTHGFQYVRIEGHPGDLTAGRRHAASSCTPTCAAPAGSPAATSGSTGCTRPRCGASATTPATSRPTARTGAGRLDRRLAAVRAHRGVPLRRRRLLHQWLRDVAADQWPDGTVANISPSRARRGPGQPGRVPQRLGRLGRRRGHRAVGAVPGVRRHRRSSPSCGRRWSRWLDRAERMARDQRHPAAGGAPPEPAPHEQYLWDTGFHWGEWLVPGEDLGDFGASSPPTRATSPPPSSPLTPA